MNSVAPNSRATLSLAGSMSMAMTLVDPARTLAWMTLRPMPPMPNTATLSPYETLARLSTAPTPVITAQPTRAADSSGTSSGIFTAWRSSTTVRSTKAETLAKAKAFSPSMVNGLVSLPMLLAHIVGCPDSQAGQSPQLDSVENTTWSPGWRVVTWSPTSSTTPAASWPSTTGGGKGMVPLTTLRSL